MQQSAQACWLRPTQRTECPIDSILTGWRDYYCTRLHVTRESSYLVSLSVPLLGRPRRLSLAGRAFFSALPLYLIVYRASSAQSPSTTAVVYSSTSQCCCSRPSNTSAPQYIHRRRAVWLWCRLSAAALPAASYLADRPHLPAHTCARSSSQLTRSPTRRASSRPQARPPAASSPSKQLQLCYHVLHAYRARVLRACVWLPVRFTSAACCCCCHHRTALSCSALRHAAPPAPPKHLLCGRHQQRGRLSSA